MKALVIGGMSGQVTQSLAELDDPVFRIDVRGRPQVNLADASTLAAAIADAKPDVVICCGAYTAVDQAEGAAGIAHAVNAVGPTALAKLCAQAGIPILHLSTDYVFDGSKTSPYLETDTPSPQTVYGATKLEGEIGVTSSGARHLILRTSWVHAPFGVNFVRTMLRLARSRERISVVADQIGRPTYAPHLAIAIRDLAARLALDPSAPAGVFHLTGSGEACSWRQFAEAIFTASQVRGGPFAAADPITSSSYPTPAKRPANSVLDCSKLADAYGLVMPHWKQGMEECISQIAACGWQAS